MAKSDVLWINMKLLLIITVPVTLLPEPDCVDRAFVVGAGLCLRRTRAGSPSVDIVCEIGLPLPQRARRRLRRHWGFCVLVGRFCIDRWSRQAVELALERTGGALIRQVCLLDGAAVHHHVMGDSPGEVCREAPNGSQIEARGVF